MIDPQVPLTSLVLSDKRRKQGILLEQHQHPQGLVIAIHSGLVILHTGARVRCVMPGQLCWIPGNLSHGTHWFGAIDGICLYLQPALCHHLPEDSMIFNQTPLSEALIRRLADPLMLTHAHTMSLAECLIHEILQAESGGFHLPMPQDPRLLTLSSQFLDQPDNHGSIESWARHAGMSLSTLTRRFREQTGMTPGQWRQQARMLYALELLFSGGTVTSVSLAVGYDSVSAFIHGFRKIFGVTPARYFVPSSGSTE